MTAAAVLAEARGRGITLSSRGDRLAFDAPAGAMTPDFRESIAANKGDLLALLAAPPADPPDDDPGGWEASRPDERDPVAMAGWWIRRYRAAGVEPPAEMIERAAGGGAGV